MGSRGFNSQSVTGLVRGRSLDEKKHARAPAGTASILATQALKRQGVKRRAHTQNPRNETEEPRQFVWSCLRRKQTTQVVLALAFSVSNGGSISKLD